MMDKKELGYMETEMNECLRPGVVTPTLRMMAVIIRLLMAILLELRKK